MPALALQLRRPLRCGEWIWIGDGRPRSETACQWWENETIQLPRDHEAACLRLAGWTCFVAGVVARARGWSADQQDDVSRPSLEQVSLYSRSHHLHRSQEIPTPEEALGPGLVRADQNRFLVPAVTFTHWSTRIRRGHRGTAAGSPHAEDLRMDGGQNRLGDSFRPGGIPDDAL
jgi:hypothetical protein